MLGTAAKVEVSKESTTIVGDGSTEAAVKARVRQIRNLITETEQDYEKEKLNERVARLSGGVAIIQVGSSRVYGHLWVQLIALGSDPRLLCNALTVQEGLCQHIIFRQIPCAP